ncbi:MAG: LD-carboxypeptidase [Flavobacteriales bacterium]|nr:LD-carboxypeptidase [Flavobacteriales bacterium]
MSSRVPPPLRPGDTIAIIPTARFIALDELRDGIALAESWGLKVQLGAGIGRKHFQQAGTASERTADLQAAINDPTVRAIWCARGGYGTVHLLEGLDLAPLKQDPKWIIGFSDITVLHNALSELGVASLHAQMPFNIASKTAEAKETLRKALFGAEYQVASSEWRVASAASDPAALATRHSPLATPHSHSPLATPRIGSCEGILTGGNLSILYALRGTPYDLDPRRKILFLEDLDELRYHADRMIQNLRLGGWFHELAGLVVGGMSDMRDKNPDDPFGMEVEEMIAEAVAPYSYPVCYGFPAGHIDDNRALVFGQKAKLSVTANGATLSFGGIVRPSGAEA